MSLSNNMNIGALASAIAIGRGLYDAGRYAAKQCVSRGWLSRAQYKKILNKFIGQ